MVRRVSGGLAVLLLLHPGPVRAVDLVWSNGTSDLRATAATVCTLMVKPSPGEFTLPAEWRLLWAGEAAVDTPLVFLEQPGPPEASPTCSVAGPASEADRLSRRVTVQFCGSDDGQPTSLAAFVLRVDPTFHGRLTAVPASDISRFQVAARTHSEVTVNGGTTMEFPPSLWTVTPLADRGGPPQAGLTGVGLDHVNHALFWRASTSMSPESLQILSRCPTAITVRLPVPLGPGQTLLLANGPQEASTAAAISASEPSPASSGPAMIPDWPYRAKDFALIHAGGQFHIFYIRHDVTLPTSATEKDFGHAVSPDLVTWTQLPAVLPVRPDHWDSLHVWAPSIVESGGTYYMFYTGVSRNPSTGTEFQRTGLATSTNLLDWTRDDQPIFACGDVPWSYCTYSQVAGSQFRDPFVVERPGFAGQWLMSYVTIPDAAHKQLIAAAAQSAAGDLEVWTDLQPLWNTDLAHFLGWVESPHMFDHNGLWYLFLTSNASHPITYQTAADPAADSTGWSPLQRLYYELGNDGSTDSWFASEHLKVGSHDYFAAANSINNGIEIREMSWGTPPHFSLGAPVVTGLGQGTPGAGLGFSCRSPAGSGISLRIELPSPMAARVEVFDVTGRRIGRVLDRMLPSGTSIVAWDGRDDRGSEATCGIYFARLSTQLGIRAVRLPLIH